METDSPTPQSVPAWRKFVITPLQLALLLLGKIFLLPLTRRSFEADLGHIAGKPHIIVANHKKALDPFTITAALPFRTIFKILPVAFMIHNFFYDSPIRPLAWLGGCFPAKNPKGKHKLYGVEGSLAFINHGYSILIFPEGTRVREERGQARPGVIRIHQARPEVPFILCQISYPKGLKNRLTGRWRVVKFKLVKNPNYTDPEKVMDDVFAL